MSIQVSVQGVKEITVKKIHSPAESQCHEYVLIRLDVKARDYANQEVEYTFDLFLDKPGFTVRKLDENTRVIEVRK